MGVSTKSFKRGDHIICSHLDRFSRNTLNLLQLVEKFRKQKVSLHFVDVSEEVTGTDAEAVAAADKAGCEADSSAC
jgi:DNA invertase Pin-like site-specific DNA recombinase